MLLIPENRSIRGDGSVGRLAPDPGDPPVEILRSYGLNQGAILSHRRSQSQRVGAGIAPGTDAYIDDTGRSFVR